MLIRSGDRMDELCVDVDGARVAGVNRKFAVAPTARRPCVGEGRADPCRYTPVSGTDGRTWGATA